MKTLRQLINKAFGWEEDPDYESITVVPGFYIEKDPRAIIRDAKESGSWDALQRWIAKRDKQLKEQQAGKTS